LIFIDFKQNLTTSVSSIKIMTQKVSSSFSSPKKVLLQNKLRKTCSALGLGIFISLGISSPVFSEGSQQLGSGDQGLNVYLFEYNAQNTFIQTSQSPRPIKVNVEAAGEVINISLCGWNASNDLAIEVFRPNGTEINYSTQVAGGSPGSFSSTAAIGTGTTGSGGWRLTDGNARTSTQTTICNNTANPTQPSGNLSNPVRFIAPEAGTYEIRLYNDTETYNSSNNVFTYFDITVTPNSSTNPDPTVNQGLVWATTWAFNAGNTFGITGGYDADLYVRTPGGRPNTEFIWQLDLNNFAPQRHEIIANSIGLNPNFSRYSVPGSSTPTYTKNFPIYLSPPNSFSLIAPILSEPTPPTLSNLRFVDSAGEDSTFSPNGTTSIQDKGFFIFDADVTGTYEIIIDTNNNGVFGTGDRVLFGLVNPGTNSVEWDGKGFNNATLVEGKYNARVSLRIGEYHFLTFDAETSGGGANDGLSIWKWSGLSSSRSPVLNFWDDATYLGGTFPAATTNINGAMSDTAAGKHTWGNFASGSLGDTNYLDTWVFGASQVLTTPAIIANSSDANDFGDAPDTYGTNKDITVGGVPASHILSTNLRLGNTATDSETNGQPNAAATGDDTNNTDDENSVTTFNALTSSDTSYSVSVNYLKNVGSNVYLAGWIDFNRNGVFEASEGVTQTLTNAASTTTRTTTLNWTGLSEISPGTTYARFRINQNPMTTSDAAGGGTYGEVEDYQLTIISNTDYGDAPDTGTGTATGNYQTTLNDGGARHDIVAGLRIGSQIDADNGTLQNTNANTDDTDATPDDEDGVTTFNTLTTASGQTYTVPVNVTNTTGGNAFLVGYIDFNRDGDFEDAGEKSATVTLPNNATSGSVSFTTPTGIVVGNSYARFRLSRTQSQAETSTGVSTSGEVEDYPIVINALDYGDAIDTAVGTGTGNYKTTISDNGARHILSSNLRLGSQTDADNGTLQNTNADADDTTDAPDDEDSVTTLPVITTKVGESYTVPVSITNTTGGNAFLVGYIDFNRDGDFEDAGEKSATVTLANNATSANISFISPSAIVAGTTYMRLRVSSTQTQAESSFGLANNGEVEDYPLTIGTAAPAQLKLLKRITSVTRGGNSIVPINSQPFNAFNEDSIANNEDNDVKWPDSNNSTGNNSDAINIYLNGAINGGQVIKNDIIEYTIYFLNTGGLDAQNVRLCDRVPANTTFVPDAFGTGQGISLAFNNASLPTVPNLIYTNDRTDADGGKYFPAGVEPTGCKIETAPNVFVPMTAADNTNGTVMVEIPTLPDTTGQNPFTPNNAYGFIRFRATVNPQ
jgi:uncharacterized repeat protein (TIGR01451 family)